MEKNETFDYTYSSQRQAEIKKIRNKYVPRTEDKMDRLRRLDQHATQKGNTISIAVGTLSTLVFGIGMCCTMVWTEAWFIPGIFIGLLGIAGISLAYPLYSRITKKEREKIAPEILRLADELMQ